MVLSEAEQLAALKRSLESKRLEEKHHYEPQIQPLERLLQSIAEQSKERVLTPEQEIELMRRRVEHEARKRDRHRQSAWGTFLGNQMAAYGECTLENYETNSAQQSEVKKQLISYRETIHERVDSGEGILLYGPSGTGKDHLAIGVIRAAVLEFDMTALRINGQEWFGDIRDMIGASSDKRERDEINRLSGPDMLLISDPLPPIGPLSQHQATMLYRVVCKRYEMSKPTVVTVNVKDGTEAGERMGVAVWDRMKDRAWVAPCNWPSHRKPARVIGGGR